MIYIQLIARSSCIAEDCGNSYAHTVGALSNDDDTEDCYVILKSRNWGIRPLFSVIDGVFHLLFVMQLVGHGSKL